MCLRACTQLNSSQVNLCVSSCNFYQTFISLSLFLFLSPLNTIRVILRSALNRLLQQSGVHVSTYRCQFSELVIFFSFHISLDKRITVTFTFFESIRPFVGRSFFFSHSRAFSVTLFLLSSKHTLFTSVSEYRVYFFVSLSVFLSIFRCIFSSPPFRALVLLSGCRWKARGNRQKVTEERRRKKKESLERVLKVVWCSLHLCVASSANVISSLKYQSLEIIHEEKEEEEDKKNEHQ